jgi:AraC family ethanolamine operon transcriptional activator
MYKPFCHRRWFTNFDELAENALNWNLEISQLEKGKFASYSEQFSTCDIQISTAQFNGHTHQTGDSPPGRTFALLDNATRINWLNHSIGNDSLMIFPARGGDIDVITPKGVTNVITLTASNRLLNKLLTEQDTENVTDVMFNNEIVHLPIGTLHRIRNRWKEYLYRVQRFPELIHSNTFQEEISQNLVEEIIGSLSNRGVLYSKPSIEHDLWDRLDEMIGSSLDKPIRIQELCLAAQISERTLRRYFHKRFGLSPINYLNLKRLNKVRANLKQATKRKGVVTDIANKWGFWHMGQFAQDYRHLFGELPSETLDKWG